jgi:hypothetical protein
MRPNPNWSSIEHSGIWSMAVFTVQYLEFIRPHADGSALFLSVFDDLSRSPAPARWLTIPNSDENIAMIHQIPADLHVSIAAQFGLIAGIVADAELA